MLDLHTTPLNVFLDGTCVAHLKGLTQLPAAVARRNDGPCVFYVVETLDGHALLAAHVHMDGLSADVQDYEVIATAEPWRTAALWAASRHHYPHVTFPLKLRGGPSGRRTLVSDVYDLTLAIVTFQLGTDPFGEPQRARVIDARGLHLLDLLTGDGETSLTCPAALHAAAPEVLADMQAFLHRFEEATSEPDDADMLGTILDDLFGLLHRPALAATLSLAQAQHRITELEQALDLTNAAVATIGRQLLSVSESTADEDTANHLEDLAETCFRLGGTLQRTPDTASVDVLHGTLGQPGQHRA